MCDEWAVRNSANRFALARCLTRVAEWTARFSPQPVELAAVGAESSLSERVESLIVERPRDDAWNSRAAGDCSSGQSPLAIACGLARSAPRSSVLAEPPIRVSPVALPDSSTHSQSDAKASWTDALTSLNHETRDLLSDLRRVEQLLKGKTPPNPALAAVAVRLKSRVTVLVNDQARLAAMQTSTFKPEE